jgi:hypothetical protein
MLRIALLTLLALAVAIGGGAASVWYALGSEESIGATAVGTWLTYPDLGTVNADPYSRAKVAREGALVLGRAEGLRFVAQRDAAGEPLVRQCRYTVEGTIPPARIWTLYAAERGGAPVPPARALNAQIVTYLPGGSLAATVGARAAPGNWLATSGSGPMALVLTLYDSPVAVSTGVSDIQLPRIAKVGCDG